MLESSTIPHPSDVINERLLDEQTQLRVQAQTDYTNDLTKGMVPCLFEDYYKDWDELRIIREYKEKIEQRRVST